MNEKLLQKQKLPSGLNGGAAAGAVANGGGAEAGKKKVGIK